MKVGARNQTTDLPLKHTHTHARAYQCQIAIVLLHLNQRKRVEINPIEGRLQSFMS